MYLILFLVFLLLLCLMISSLTQYLLIVLGMLTIVVKIYLIIKIPDWLFPDDKD